MKLAIAGLTCLGIVAAVCAALLVSALRAGTIRQGRGLGDDEVQVLVATRPLREMTVVDSGSVISKTMARNQAPLGFISDPVQVVGRILIVAVAEGHSFTTNCFTTDDKSAHLAALLPKGKRAVGITVSDYAGLEGVLYPGCAVDIMLTGKTDSGDGKLTPVSKLLLENIPVWGIEKQTIVSSADKVGADAESPKSSTHRRIVVLVDTNQAKLLEKGMEGGTLSLALRNPLDNATQGTDHDEALTPVKSLGDVMNLGWGNIFSSLRQKPGMGPASAGAPATGPAQWQVIVTRGEQSQTQSFSMSKADDAGYQRHDEVP